MNTHEGRDEWLELEALILDCLVNVVLQLLVIQIGVNEALQVALQVGIISLNLSLFLQLLDRIVNLFLHGLVWVPEDPSEGLWVYEEVEEVRVGAVGSNRDQLEQGGRGPVVLESIEEGAEGTQTLILYQHSQNSWSSFFESSLCFIQSDQDAWHESELIGGRSNLMVLQDIPECTVTHILCDQNLQYIQLWVRDNFVFILVSSRNWDSFIGREPQEE